METIVDGVVQLASIGGPYVAANLVGGLVMGGGVWLGARLTKRR